ncbi:uncharacterized protein [Physcomitrium patens]|uniref:Uncharacterized protein n=1 Tax=Physcomitrium patens TaxID=3218 RepID=A0A2K1IDX9_PHYPA|nr:golgin subfamily A member 4-like isoform X4 [Physcomitrium patens]PNR27485.1 hypothetical protein PHYPA_029637 [Physcomitrium patens]|eukprot:XP_024365147.1 golgin subfamily A member 4-like isoform X4 [Physcomitrella patens]
MASPVEVIPGWSDMNDRLHNTLVQLNRLMEHYADGPPSDDLRHADVDKPGCVSEECLETDIQDILKEAKQRLKDFTEAMGSTNGISLGTSRRERQEAEEKSQRILAESEHQKNFLKEELARAQHEVINLHQKMRGYEDRFACEQAGLSNAKFSRELERTKIELLEKSTRLESLQAAKEAVEKEFSDYRKTRKQELEREKTQKLFETRQMKENFQKEVMSATQQHLDREVELQEFCQNERDAHTKTVEDMTTLHAEEIKKLKAEHAMKLEECCHNHAFLESEWLEKEFGLHKQISGAVQEKSRHIQLLFEEHLKLQSLETQLAAAQSELANEKLERSQIESELKFAKVDVSLANEKVKMGLESHEHTLSNLTNLQDEMTNLRRTCAANIAKLEEKAFALQKNLSCVTNTCVQNEHELHCQSRRVEELQKNIHIKQKELMASTTEVQRLQQEIKCMQSELNAKEEEKRAIQQNYDAQCHQLQTQIFKLQIDEKQKCEDMVNKTKDNLETQLLRQAQQHTKIVQKLQKQFRAQWEEYTKTGGPCF